MAVVVMVAAEGQEGAKKAVDLMAEVALEAAAMVVVAQAARATVGALLEEEVMVVAEMEVVVMEAVEAMVEVAREEVVRAAEAGWAMVEEMAGVVDAQVRHMAGGAGCKAAVPGVQEMVRGVVVQEAVATAVEIWVVEMWAGAAMAAAVGEEVAMVAAALEV